MTVEQRLDPLEKRNKRLTVALMMTVVTMGNTGWLGEKRQSNFDTVGAKRVYVRNDAGQIVVALGESNDLQKIDGWCARNFQYKFRKIFET
ncbi:hypothetical protein OAF45_00215 [Candidatus Latescibacteria bacterium]|jgi:hypothetical protein|nr:hypothetical protein [Candidatus Latescibacterota bacterium]